jgi:hypothetical protein
VSLFICSKCGCVENTALGNFWKRHCYGHPVLCSECSTGVWHGQFKKRKATEQEIALSKNPRGRWP